MHNQTLRPGEEVTATLRLPAASRFTGGQLALRWNADAVKLLGLSSADLAENANFRAGNDYLWMTWGNELSTDEVVTLRFRANRPGLLSQFLSLASDPELSDEGYDQQLNVHPLSLAWVTSTEPTDVGAGLQQLASSTEEELLGVLPNPARTYTRIGLKLQTAQTIQLTITDLNGRVMTEQQRELASGEQWLEVAVQNWPAGVYLFTVVTSNGSSSGRIMRQ